MRWSLPIRILYPKWWRMYARCLQLPDEALLARWNKQRAAQLERLKNRAEKSAEN